VVTAMLIQKRSGVSMAVAEATGSRRVVVIQVVEELEVGIIGIYKCRCEPCRAEVP
jgi:hypothetical protein